MHLQDVRRAFGRRSWHLKPGSKVSGGGGGGFYVIRNKLRLQLITPIQYSQVSPD